MSGRGLFRITIAIVAGVALLIVVFGTDSNADDERSSDEPSAVRLAEIYTEGAFYGVMITGGLLAGYVLSRA
jgi:hypothetical protein